jgi:competence protein ComEC
MNNLRIFMLLVAVISLLPVFVLAQGDGNLHIYCINVCNSACGVTQRQGDSTLIISPAGKRLLIDGGGGGSCGADYVTATFQRLIPTGGMDYMIATNWDDDHVQGLDDIATYNSNQYMPQKIYDIGYVDPDNPPTSYTNTFNVDMRITPAVGDAIDLGGGVTLTIVTVKGNVLGGAYVNPGTDENAMSIGVLIQYGGFDYVTCGDLTSDVEDKLGEALKVAGRKIDILRVSHHGASTSTSNYYCSNIQPEFAVISCGAGNTYGHPTQETINHLNGLTDSGDPYSPSYPAVKTIYLTEDPHNGTASNIKVLQPNASSGGSLHITVTSGSCFAFTNEGPNTNPINDGPYTSHPRRMDGSPMPAPSSYWPVYVQANKYTFSRRDRIEVTADFKTCQIPFYPYILLKDPNGNYLYIQRTWPQQRTKISRGAALPFRAGGPFVLDFPLDYYPVLSANFANALPGTWVIEGYFMDYYGQTLGGVCHQELTVSSAPVSYY